MHLSSVPTISDQQRPWMQWAHREHSAGRSREALEIMNQVRDRYSVYVAHMFNVNEQRVKIPTNESVTM